MGKIPQKWEPPRLCPHTQRSSFQCGHPGAGGPGVPLGGTGELAPACPAPPQAPPPRSLPGFRRGSGWGCWQETVQPPPALTENWWMDVVGGEQAGPSQHLTPGRVTMGKALVLLLSREMAGEEPRPRQPSTSLGAGSLGPLCPGRGSSRRSGGHCPSQRATTVPPPPQD